MKASHLEAFLAFFLVLALLGAGFVANIRRKTSSVRLESSVMPQPLSRVQPDAGIVLGNAGAREISQRPELAILIAEAINSWSNVEAFLLRLFVHLLGGDQTITTQIYLKLEIKSAKTIAIQEAVKSLRNKKIEDLITVVIRLSQSAGKARDKLAHHVWGFSPHPNLQDALLLADPKSMYVPNLLRPENIYVYRSQDLTDIISANDKICGYGLQIMFILQNHPANRDDQLYKQLCSQPEIREKLDRLASQAQNSQEESP